jgi:uncharacterized protein (DUF2141 family)
MLNKKALFFCINLLFGAIIFAFSGCANIQKPQGGPRDVTPPVLLKASPPDMTRHFASKTIRLDFDEFFKLTNQFQEITISPAQDKQPDYKIKEKSLIITLKDTLQKNTTYVINFGKAIADVNEGNVLKNFTYVFSTGEHIDSLSVSGTVTNTLTQLKEKDVTVMLFPADKDTAYYRKKRPSIYATTDTSGNFSLNNLPEGKFTIYALKEATVNRIYDNEVELIAFLKKPISLYTDTSGIQLNLFKEDPVKFRLLERKFDQDGKILFIFNKRLNNPSLKIIYPPGLDDQKIVEFSKTNDTAHLYSKNMDFDSISVAILDNDKPLDSISLNKGRKEKFTRSLSFGFNINAQSGKLNPFGDLIITTTSPIDTFDPSLIFMKEDSTDINNFTITRDSTNARRFILKYHWKQDAGSYLLTINDDAFTNIYDEKNKKFVKKFQIEKDENYSSLTLKVHVPDPTKAYVIELFQDIKNILSRNSFSKDTTIQFKNYYAGKYYVRIIYDDNRNGKWDTGNVKEKRQPENIWIDPQQLTLRPNWEDEEKLNIPQETLEP